MPDATVAAALKPAAKAWIVNPWADFAFFIATPLLIIPAYLAAAPMVPLHLLQVLMLSLSATGHHLPGFIRAYTDPSIFRQFRYRLLVVPALFVVLGTWATWHQLSTLFFLFIVWSTWHGAMQIHGFLRIYDAKSGFFSPWTARLDFWMSITWFVQVVLWSPGKLTSVLSSFYLAGGPLIPVPWARAFAGSWTALTVLVTVAYAVQTGLNAFHKGYFHPQKFLCMLASFGFWGYCMIAVDNLVLGLVLWEIFHDLQYNVFVWNYNRNRVRRGMSESRIERFLFRDGGWRLALYAACILAYGSLGLLSQGFVDANRYQEGYRHLLDQAGNVFAISALIHFYLDGFIWKVRDGKVRQDLGVASPATGVQLPVARHWLFVAALFAVSTALGVSEKLHLSAGQQDRMFSNLAEIVPESGFAHFMRASQLRSAGQLDSAAAHYSRAIALDTHYAFSHVYLGEILHRNGDHAAALGHFEEALRRHPGDSLVLANLGALYLGAGRFQEAATAFRNLLAQDADNAAVHYQLAFALLQLRQGLDAKPHLERSLSLDPLQPKALNYLGMVEQALGHPDRAQGLYEQALALDSAYGHARQNLAGLNQAGNGPAPTVP
jgi:tetratricopeptide (TPR) repeat protein